MGPKAIVLLSGGVDSATTLALAKNQGYQVLTLSFDDGQRHAVELDRARVIAEKSGAVESQIMKIDLRQFGGSALTTDADVPSGRGEAEMSSGIPVTYVPARNTIFLSFALAFAEARDAQDIFIGVNAIDYSGYPDCRPEFISAFETLANLATKAGVEGTQKCKIHTPLIDMTKAQIIRKGMELGVDYSLTHSCYDPDADGLSCGACDSCLLRKKGFHEAGLEDPIPYKA